MYRSGSQFCTSHVGSLLKDALILQTYVQRVAVWILADLAHHGTRVGHVMHVCLFFLSSETVDLF